MSMSPPPAGPRPLEEPDCPLHRTIAALSQAHDAYSTWTYARLRYEQERAIIAGLDRPHQKSLEAREVAMSLLLEAARRYEGARVSLGDVLRQLPAHLADGCEAGDSCRNRKPTPACKCDASR